MTEQEEDNLLGNYFLMIFQPNPMRQTIRVIIDDKVLVTTIKKEKFLNILKDTIPYQLQQRCEYYTNEYGSWFMIDRLENTVIELQSFNEEEPLLIKDIRRDVSKEREQSKQNGVDGIYESARNSFLENVLSKVSIFANNKKSLIGNTGYINYSEKNKKKKY